jgi:hypothetical protein
VPVAPGGKILEDKGIEAFIFAGFVSPLLPPLLFPEEDKKPDKGGNGEAEDEQE